MYLDREMLGTQAYWLDRAVMQLEDAGWYVDVPGGSPRQLRRLLQIYYGLDFLLQVGTAPEAVRSS